MLAQYLCLLFAISFVLNATKSSAQVGSTGGGKGVACFDQELMSPQIYTLDLFEAEEETTFMNLSEGNEGRQAIELIETYTDLGRNPVFRKIATKIDFWFQFAQKNLIRELDDTGLTGNIPASCKLVQLAYFDPKRHLVLVDMEFWDAMPCLERVALYLHEIIYAVRRSMGDKDSAYTRHMVREILSQPVPMNIAN